MRKLTTLFLCLTATLLIFSGCSSSDRDDEIIPEPKLDLVGDWLLESAEFPDAESVKRDESVKLTMISGLSWAPAMYSVINGYQFTTKPKEANGEAVKFLNIVESLVPLQPGQELWYWDYTMEGKSFKTGQFNASLPPYNFSLQEITNVKVLDKGGRVSFDAQVDSRDIDAKTPFDVHKVPVKIVLKKGTPTFTTYPKVTIAGVPYEIPDSFK